MVRDIVKELQTHCKEHKQWGILLKKGLGETAEEQRETCPFLTLEEARELYNEYDLLRYYDTQEACEADFGQAVGDEGPTDTNDYRGPANTYALMCDSEGELYAENT